MHLPRVQLIDQILPNRKRNIIFSKNNQNKRVCDTHWIYIVYLNDQKKLFTTLFCSPVQFTITAHWIMFENGAIFAMLFGHSQVTLALDDTMFLVTAYIASLE